MANNRMYLVHTKLGVAARIGTFHVGQDGWTADGHDGVKQLFEYAKKALGYDDWWPRLHYTVACEIVLQDGERMDSGLIKVHPDVMAKLPGGI